MMMRHAITTSLPFICCVMFLDVIILRIYIIIYVSRLVWRLILIGAIGSVPYYCLTSIRKDFGTLMSSAEQSLIINS